MKHLNHKPLKCIACILTFLLLLSILVGNKNVYASEYISNLSKEEISDIFELKSKDVSNPWVWINDARTYIIFENDNGNTTYWWNAPNVQMSAQNSLYDIIAVSGYGSGQGVDPKNVDSMVSIPDNAKTAMQKYGFNIPNPTYMGERPLITISLAGILMPNNPLDVASKITGAIFTGKLVKAPTEKSMNSLVYAAPRDYNPSNITFKNWVKHHWDEAINIPHNQILLTSADQSTGKGPDGKQWIKKHIIDDTGLNQSNLDADYICQKLSEITGSHYGDVAKNIILSSNAKDINHVQRIMPYDITRMTAKDAKIFNGVVDNRSVMQQSAFSTGYDKILHNIAKSWVVSISSKLSELSIALNGVATFDFLESMGFKPTDIWSNSIVQFLLLIMSVAFLLLCLKSAISVFKGKVSMVSLFLKIMGTFFIMMFIFNISYNTDATYGFIKNLSVRIFNITNVAFERNESLNSLYGNGNAKEREDTTLWLPYFNTWTSYHTNHGIFDDAQTIKLGSNPEEQGLLVPTIDGVQQTLWSTVLADDFTTRGNYSGDIYRAVDHFMAPRIKSNGGLDIEVTQNENYNGNIQSTIHLESLPFQSLILLFTLLKVLLFIEFIINISTLLLNLSLSVMDKWKLSLVLKELGASCLNITFANLAINLMVFSSLVTSGIPSFLIFLFYCFIIYAAIKLISNSNSVFTPKFFRHAKRMLFNIADKWKDGAIAEERGRREMVDHGQM